MSQNGDFKSVRGTAQRRISCIYLMKKLITTAFLCNSNRDESTPMHSEYAFDFANSFLNPIFLPSKTTKISSMKYGSLQQRRGWACCGPLDV